MHYTRKLTKPAHLRAVRSTSYDQTIEREPSEVGETPGQPLDLKPTLAPLILTSPVGLNSAPTKTERKNSATSLDQYTPPISPTDPTFHQFFLRKLSFSPGEVKVLIYDDDILHGRLVRQHLRKIGYPVDLVADMNSALEILRKSCKEPYTVLENSSTYYQLVIVSITYESSNGQNQGLEILKTVRYSDELKDLPVIMMADPEQLEFACNCLQLGADDYVLKPVRLETVKTVWRSVWRKRKERKVMQMLEEERNKRKSLELAVDMLQDQMLQAIETPINLITRTVTDLLQSTGMSDEAKKTLASILSSLKSTNLYRPAFEKLLHNTNLDPETRNWLSTEVIRDAPLSTPPDGVRLERSRRSYTSRHRRASSLEGSAYSVYEDNVWPSETWNYNHNNGSEEFVNYKSMNGGGFYYRGLNHRRNSDSQQLTRFANGLRSRRQRIHSVHDQVSSEEYFGSEEPLPKHFLDLSNLENEDPIILPKTDDLCTNFKNEYAYDTSLENIPEYQPDESEESPGCEENFTMKMKLNWSPVANEQVEIPTRMLRSRSPPRQSNSNRNGLYLAPSSHVKDESESNTTVPPTPTSEHNYLEPPPSPSAISPMPQRAMLLNSWAFDVWSYTEMELLPFLVDIFSELGFIEYYDISLETLTVFLHTVKDGYNTSQNPYHNFRHAFDVTQAGYLFLCEACDLYYNENAKTKCENLLSLLAKERKLQLLRSTLDSMEDPEQSKTLEDSQTHCSQESGHLDGDPPLKTNYPNHSVFTMNERFAFIVACLCHDLSHDGHTNNFHVATSSELAIMYNDSSVLENFHAHQTFVLLRTVPEANIFENLSASVVAELRSIIIKCILATDMGRHMEVMANFNECVTSGWKWDDRSHRLRLLEMLMKCADVSNTVRPLHLARAWSDLIQEEMFSQGDLEKDIQLPVSAFGDRGNPQQPRLAITFADFVVTPLFKAISDVLPSIMTHVRSCGATREYWNVFMNSVREKTSDKETST